MIGGSQAAEGLSESICGTRDLAQRRNAYLVIPGPPAVTDWTAGLR